MLVPVHFDPFRLEWLIVIVGGGMDGQDLAEKGGATAPTGHNLAEVLKLNSFQFRTSRLTVSHFKKVASKYPFLFFKNTKLYSYLIMY